MIPFLNLGGTEPQLSRTVVELGDEYVMKDGGRSGTGKD